MTPILCAEHIADLLKGAFELYVPTDEKVASNSITIRSGFLPKTTTAADKQKQNPAIVVRPTQIDDDTDGSNIKLQLLATVYNEDKESGHLELYNILEIARQAILKNWLVAEKNALQMPVKTIIPEEQPFPVWWGYMELEYSVGQPQPNYFTEY